jgi:monofunctional biosynthetic peptidoglycan transglycosylase
MFVGHSTRSTDSRGVRAYGIVATLFAVALGSNAAIAEAVMVLFDFGTEGHAAEWAAINDVVMGGVSTGKLRPTSQGTAVFTGRLSLENNGGFASVRSHARQRDLSAYQGIALRVRGDGGRYKLNIKTDSRFDGLQYRHSFETTADEWQTVFLPFGEFVPTFRGRIVPDAPPMDLSRITSLGLMISDKQAGPFRLEVESIWVSGE